MDERSGERGCGTSILVVIDMQNDFITGALGTAEARAILPGVIERVRSWDGEVLCTLDTHDDSYADTQEGRRLPVPHCIKGTDGWRMPAELRAALDAKGARTYEKRAFGSPALARDLAARTAAGGIERIELVGVCTDICVVSNALLIKAFAPEVPVQVDARLCAGVTPAAHDAALATMRSCQVDIIGA